MAKRGAWWQIDLGKEYLIDALSLFGRSDSKYIFQMFSFLPYN
jgi:hypothetical protein